MTETAQEPVRSFRSKIRKIDYVWPIYLFGLAVACAFVQFNHTAMNFLFPMAFIFGIYSLSHVIHILLTQKTYEIDSHKLMIRSRLNSKVVQLAQIKNISTVGNSGLIIDDGRRKIVISADLENFEDLKSSIFALATNATLNSKPIGVLQT